jgi:oxygen-dependent protoporphyrinogen oxidase
LDLTVHQPETSPQTECFDLALSTLRNNDLTPYVTVMTVNLFFPNPSILPVQGFGYLIPQSVPFEQNPERALGVIFDSGAMDTVKGTKITVMMGGHWWDGWTEYPTSEEGLAMALSILKRHMNITDSPTAHVVNLAKDCIPQYTLGYEDRLKSLSAGLSSTFKGRLQVVGAQVNGVGVNDCITGAWHVAQALKGEGWRGRNCGLDRVTDERPWRVVSWKEMAYKSREVSGGVPDAGLGRRGDGGV